MENKKISTAKRTSLFSTGGLMMVSALLFWLCDIGIVPALCLAAAGLCFFSAGLNDKNKERDENKE